MIPLNRRRVGAMAVGALGVILIAVASGYRVSPKIIYNPSSSAPRGWYAVKSPTELHRGDFALVKLAGTDRADCRRASVLAKDHSIAQAGRGGGR